MADLNEVYALLHVHESLQKHGDMFPNLKAHVLNKLREVEADHTPAKPEEAVEEPVEVVEDEPVEDETVEGEE